MSSFAIADVQMHVRNDDNCAEVERHAREPAEVFPVMIDLARRTGTAGD